MTHYNKVTFNHALLGTKVHVVLGTIVGYHYSEKSKATHVYTNGGVFPVNETCEEVTKLIKEAAAPIASNNIGATPNKEDV
jgi:hypothetical protein